MDNNKITTIEDSHDSRMFNKKIQIVSGEGAILKDVDGKEYIDCIGGHGVSVLGYSQPRIIKTLCQYLQDHKPITCGHFYDENRAKLMDKLVTNTPAGLDRVFFCNSGTESVEAALKFAMKYKKDIKNKEIIAFKRGFHGRTLGALSTTFEPRYRKDYPPIPHVQFASYNNVDSVKDLITDNTIAVIMELIQGEGGVHPASGEFPGAMREICTEHDIPLIFDEVQTGFGRTGKLFAMEHWNVKPDILCLAKGIAAGVPMGATITTSTIMDSLTAGEHGTTFGGNPFACAAAVESLDIIREEGLVEQAAKIGEFLNESLVPFVETYRLLREIRGKGLMIGLQMRTKVKGFIEKLREKGLLALNAGLTVVRFLPPLVISMDQAKKVIEIVESTLESL